jgi:predicted ferric reductase
LAKHESNLPSGRKIILIWATKNKSTAFHDRELNTEMKNNKNFEYIAWFSSKKGRLNITEVEKIIKNKMELKNIKILMCGPPPMVYNLSRSFHKSGVKYHNIIFEDFNMLD